MSHLPLKLCHSALNQRGTNPIGIMEVEIFEHYKMTQVGIFFKPQRRKANEGARISNLNPDTRMNSRDEFRQGTNITMRAMRGVGV